MMFEASSLITTVLNEIKKIHIKRLSIQVRNSNILDALRALPIKAVKKRFHFFLYPENSHDKHETKI